MCACVASLRLKDGFLYGSVGEAKGLVPSNFVEKIRDLSEEGVSLFLLIV